MFRKMRRSAQELSEGEAAEILRAGQSGVLSVLGDDGYPYAVPLSYVYEDGAVYIHCAPAGHKIDAVRQHDQVSFCVVGQDLIAPERFTTLYKSAILFGRAEIVTELSAKERALQLLVEKYSPGYEKEGEKAVSDSLERVCILKIRVDALTGKASKYLIS